MLPAGLNYTRKLNDNMARLNIERQNDLQPKRTAFAKAELEKMGYEIIFEKDDIQLNFKYKGATISYFPYSGYHSGKTIEAGRGWEHLYKQIKP